MAIRVLDSVVYDLVSYSDSCDPLETIVLVNLKWKLPSLKNFSCS